MHRPHTSTATTSKPSIRGPAVTNLPICDVTRASQTEYLLGGRPRRGNVAGWSGLGLGVGVGAEVESGIGVVGGGMSSVSAAGMGRREGGVRPARDFRVSAGTVAGR